MGFTSFIVRLEPDQQAYVSGQVITGCLCATVDSPTKCRAVIVSCKGKAKVHWRERVNEEDKDFDSSERYFNISKTFWEGDKIPAGNYQWPFEFVLPAGYPSSFEGSKGWVRYYLKAKADLPLAFDVENETYFSYSNQDDLNLNIRAMEPLVINQTDTSCCFPCKEGPVTLNFNCQRSGAVIGENFKLRGEISNDGSSSTIGSSVVLQQQVAFRAGGRTERTSRDIAIVQRGGLDPGESEFFDDVDLFIPAVAPSLNNCRIMDLTYILKFDVDTGSCGSVKRYMYFNIGTVPFKVEGASIAMPIGPPSQIPSPAPPPYVPPQNMHLAVNDPSAPPTNGEFVHPTKDEGSDSPSKNGGYGPPPPVGFNAVSAPPPAMLPPVAPAVANPYPITGPPVAEACFNCSKPFYKRLDKLAPPPTYLSYRTVMTYN